MFYCLFALNYRNISLADYLGVVFYVYVTNYSQYAKQKKNGRGYPPFPYGTGGNASVHMHGT